MSIGIKSNSHIAFPVEHELSCASKSVAQTLQSDAGDFRCTMRNFDIYYVKRCVMVSGDTKTDYAVKNHCHDEREIERLEERKGQEEEKGSFEVVILDDLEGFRKCTSLHANNK
ncbi:hypothetical protein JEQ12_018754 [Ovis aries]|uniref:Uncharacterized protein n=1 Tax=Ovis aries TaxID=9940 RepID=A0A836A1X4_SHEEP|nr:hypothetical protein JEQ12_018754 [Ovis aries]